MSSNSLFVDHTPRNITTTSPKPIRILSAKQKLQNFGKLKELEERYPEKQADEKKKGIQRISPLCVFQIFIKFQYQSVIFRLNCNLLTSAIQSATHIINMAMYISFGPVFILYFCYSWTTVSLSTI